MGSPVWLWELFINYLGLLMGCFGTPPPSPIHLWGIMGGGGGEGRIWEILMGSFWDALSPTMTAMGSPSR